MPYPKSSKKGHRHDKTKSPGSTEPPKDPEPNPTAKYLPVSRNDPICREWPSLLREIVRKIDHDGVCIITCVLQKKGRDPGFTTTILVVCNSPKPPSHRYTSIAKIRGLLDEISLSSVSVEFVPGDFTREASGLHKEQLDRRVLHQPSMIGQSLAPRGTYGSGTLGGFIEIKLPGQSSYKTLALTCFHCVNPSEEDLDPDLVERVRMWREKGVEPDDDLRRELQMEHPSSMAMEDKIASLTDEIQGIETSEQYGQFRELEGEDIESMLGRTAARTFTRMKDTLSNLNDFLGEIEAFKSDNRAAFGHVYAASGFRTTPPASGITMNLDWALIEVPNDRIGHNVTPDGHDLKEAPVPENLEGMQVFIHGQRSGHRKGIKHPLESAVLDYAIIDGKSTKRTTYEHSIHPAHTPEFSHEGDSGSLVFTASHVVIGMLFAGGLSHSMSYFTPIEVLVEDIKEVTKATDVRLKMDRSSFSS
ncbi:hypothetical protein N7519_006430 [Penicillium mononematosum]|uniref:uncharacterized protein n=1 Tax=Penicillium mononematosum TaxID=268346 RepID=UPI00254871B2|nr:uncharacterized protein N7519_006430 [Penicillium mononematosum]KAJ6185129.1 hypothetical protein N7519_006430 [Penicillium mononematosum]